LCLGFSFIIVVLINAGSAFGQIPTISSITPLSGSPGAIVNINGTNFTGITNVTFGGLPAASYVVNSIKEILNNNSKIYNELYQNIMNANLSYGLAWFGKNLTEINAIYYWVYSPDEKTNDFITYVENEPNLEDFIIQSKKCLNQALRLMKYGLFHSSLVSMYNNIYNNRPLLLTIDIFKFWKSRAGTGRLSTIFSAGKYSNFRKIGLADFGEIITKDQMKHKYIDIFKNF
jgi:hypothetical protein